MTDQSRSLILWNPSQCLFVVDTMTDGDKYPFLVIQQTEEGQPPSYLVIPSQEPLSAIRKVRRYMQSFLAAFELWNEDIPAVEVEIWDGDGIGESVVLAQYLQKYGLDELLERLNREVQRTLRIDMTEEGQIDG